MTAPDCSALGPVPAPFGPISETARLPVCRRRGDPRGADVPFDRLLLVAQTLVFRKALVVGCLRARREEMSVENRNFDVHPDAFISVRRDAWRLINVRQ